MTDQRSDQPTKPNIESIIYSQQTVMHICMYVHIELNNLSNLDRFQLSKFVCNSVRTKKYFIIFAIGNILCIFPSDYYVGQLVGWSVCLS